MTNAQTFEDFMGMYQVNDAQVFDIGPEAAEWTAVVVKAGNKVAVVQFMNVSADDPQAQHLCIDVHAFVDGEQAGASVFGMEVGRRVEGFPRGSTRKTSHGMPATPLVSVLVGAQQEVDRDAN